MDYEMTYTLVESMEQLEQLLIQANKLGIFSFDYETSPTRNYRNVMNFTTKAEANRYYKDKKTLKMPSVVPQYANICTISFCFNEVDAYIVPVRHKQAPEYNLDADEVFEMMDRYIFSDEDVVKIAYNLIFEAKFTMNEGYLLSPNCVDPMHLCIRWKEQNQPYTLQHPKYTGQGLKAETLRVFDHKMLEFSDVTKGKHFDELSVLDADTLRYSGEDALCSLWLYYHWKEKLEAMPITKEANGIEYGERPFKNYYEYVTKVECDVLRVIGMMEYYGICFGNNYEKVKAMAEKEMAEIKDKIEGIGKAHNVDFGIKKALVTKTLKKFVFEDLKCPVTLLGKTGASLAKGEIIKMLKMIHNNVPTVQALESDEMKATCQRELKENGVDRYPHRDVLIPLLQGLTRSTKLSTLISTQLVGRMGYRNIEDGRIHAQYHVYLETGRFASSNPNGQNISRNKGKNDPLSVRNIYHPEEGHIMACLDYQAQEVRVGGIIYKEPNIIEAVNNGADIHTVTANITYNKNYDPYKEKADKEYRDPAKVIIFQGFYGGSKWSVHNKMAIDGIFKTMEECDMLMKGLHKAYPTMKPFQKQMENFMYDNGYCETLMGFRKYIGKMSDMDNKEYSRTLRAGYNMPIQGTSADFTKNCLNLIYEWIRTNDKYTTKDVKVVGTVHDEIVFEIKKCDPKDMKEIISNLQRLMEVPIMEGLPVQQVAEAEIVDCHNIYNLPEHMASKVCFGWGEKHDYDEWIKEVDDYTGHEQEEEITVF